VEPPAVSDNAAAPAVTPDRPARCPRCGYSQRGLIESWQDTCPVRGTCAECGLSFSFSEVLRPELHEPRWCVEYTARRHWWPLPPLLPTLLRTLRPWRFWRSMKMSHAVRPGRLLVFIGMLMVLLASCYVVEQTVLAMRARVVMDKEMRRRDGLQRAMIPPQVTVLEQVLMELKGEIPSLEGRPLDLWPHWLDRPRTDEQRAETLAHVQKELARHQAALGAPPPAPTSTLGAGIREAVGTPWASTSTGRFSSLYGNRPYPAPRELPAVVEQFSNTPGGKGNIPWNRLPGAVIGMGGGLSLLVGMPIAFVLLPISRRQAKVRWVHIIRVAAYGLAVPLVMAACALGVLALAWLADGVRAALLAVTLLAFAWVPVPFVILWWRAAIGSYLKMSRASSITAAMVVVTLLAVLTMTWLLVPAAAIDIIERVVFRLFES
jgi:hypothetical protein